jgi:uncharacterized protein (TIRG00374 family)
MNTVEVPLRKRKIPKWVVPVFGYGISAISLVWVFSKFPFAQLGHHLRTMDWAWVAVAIIAEVLVYFADAWRWKVILSPVGAPSFVSCLQAVFVGLFANDILPARAGEIIRCFLLSYKTEIHLPLALTSDFIERMMDGLWIVLIYVVITFRVSTHVAVNDVMWAFGSGVVAISLLIVWILFHRQHAHHFVNTRSWGARVIHLFEEIHSLGHWRELGIAFAIGGLYWLLQALAIWALCRADSFYFGPSEVAFLLVVKSVGTLVPSAPANMGLYQSSSVYALRLLLTEKSDAEILAEIMFGFLTLPLVIGGAIAIASAGFRLDDLHRHAHDAHTRRLPKKEE